MWKEAIEAGRVPGQGVLHPAATGEQGLIHLCLNGALPLWGNGHFFPARPCREKVENGFVFLLVNLGDQKLQNRVVSWTLSACTQRG